MALTDFFRINLPYGMRKNQTGEWFVFNREYVPLGWNRNEADLGEEELFNDRDFAHLPIHTTYFGLTDKAIMKIMKEENMVRRDSHGNIQMIFFYNDGTNPSSNPQHWKDYSAILKGFASFEKETKYHILRQKD
jgi:hypothetical protein